MAKDKLEDWDEVAANNLDMGGISLAENIMRPPAVNNEMREHMAQMAKWLGDDTIVAASSIDIGALPGRYISITGNTTIDALGTVKAGTIKYLKFTGTPTITYNATSLILPVGSNIVAAVGDTAVVVSEGSGNWRVLVYQRASGLPLGNPAGNLAFAATVAGNALTVSLKGIDGNDPSTSNAIAIPFRSATSSSGDVDVVTITAATSLVISSGSTLGTANATAANLVVVVFNDSGTARMGVINPRSGQTVFDSIASSTAEGGAGAADSAGVFYTGTAVTSKAYTVIGYIKVTQAVAGTWATAPSRVQTGQAAAVADDLLANSLPMFACRAFVNFSASGGTITIRRSGNVTSVVRNAIGDYTVTMTTAMPDINYTVMTSLSADLPSSWVGTVGMHSTQSAMTAPTTTVFRISVRDPGNSAADYPYISVSVFY